MYRNRWPDVVGIGGRVFRNTQAGGGRRCAYEKTVAVVSENQVYPLSANNFLPPRQLSTISPPKQSLIKRRRIQNRA